MTIEYKDSKRIVGLSQLDITHDTTSSTESSGSVSSLTHSMTVADNSNRVLIACVSSYGGSAPTITGVTWNGDAMTAVPNSESYQSGSNNRTQIYYIIAPDTGSHSIVASFSGSATCGIGGMSFYNVDQTTPVGAGNTSSATSTATSSLALTPTVTGSWIIAMISSSSSLGSATGLTQSYTEGTNALLRGGRNESPTIGSANTVGWGTSNHSHAMSGCAIIPYGDVKPTNVQDNSLLVEKDTAKRYWFETATAPTFEDDTFSSGWTSTGSDVVTGTNVIDFDFSNSNATNTISYDLGSTMSDTNWVLRFKLIMDNYNVGSSGNSAGGYFGLFSADHATNDNATQDSIMMNIRATSAGSSYHKYYYADCDGETPRNKLTGDGSFTHTPTEETLYVEIKRTSSTAYTINLYSDSSYSTLVESKTGACASTVTGLRYIKFMNLNSASVSDHDIDGTIDDVEFYNAVTSVTPATWTNPKDFQGVSGLKLRLDASLGITGSSTVSAWADQSFKGDNNFVQATSGSQPTLTASNSSFNNKPTLSFDGSDDNMTCTFPTPLTNDCSVYMVTNGSASTDSKWYEGVGTLKDTIQFGTDQGGGNKNYWSSASATTTGGGIESANAVNTAACIFRLNYELNGKGYKDGVEISTSSNNMKAGIGVASLTLGGEGTSGFGRGNFRLAEFLLFDHVLSASDNTLIMTYLEDKYSL